MMESAAVLFRLLFLLNGMLFLLLADGGEDAPYRPAFPTVRRLLNYCCASSEAVTARWSVQIGWKLRATSIWKQIDAQMAGGGKAAAMAAYGIVDIDKSTGTVRFSLCV